MTTLVFDVATLRKVYAQADKQIYFVKDEGIYLMADTHKPGIDPVAYAKGYEPDATNSWDKCREAVGGDDFGEHLEKDYFKCLADERTVKIALVVTDETLQLRHWEKKVKK